VGAGAAEGAVDAANILKPSLARGELQTIGATTLDDYRKHIERDAALERRFQPIVVEEPSEEDTLAILRGIKHKYEEHHKLTITDEALVAATEMSARYITDRALPDKAIDLVDESASRVRIRQSYTPPSLKEAMVGLESTRKEKEAAIQAQQYEYAAELRDRELKLQERIAELEKDLDTARDGDEAVVTQEDIAEVVSMWTGIPLVQIATEESQRLLHMEQALHDRVVGQEEPINALAKAVRRARAGLKDPRRPIGVFMFLGPTGVGKTELARALAEYLFDDEEAMIRLDMSEYQERHTVSRIVGAPPGYVGYEEGGSLTEAVRRRPYKVILFDEIEKAHPDLFNLLLQILDDGRLTDGQGRTVDFRNTIIIMTSNLGTSSEAKGRFGFVTSRAQDDGQREQRQEQVEKALREAFRPEFLNRIDEIIVFEPLTEKELTFIVDLMLEEVRKRLSDRKVEFEVTDGAKAELVKQGYDRVYGARPLRRTVQRKIENPLAKRILAGDFDDGDTVRVDWTGEEFSFHKAMKEASAPEREAAVV